jgi:hypothetical protein
MAVIMDGMYGSVDFAFAALNTYDKRNASRYAAEYLEVLAL